MREKTYRIGEAADMLRLKSYVLRFWETEFPQLAPLRTDKGQRLYTDYHIALLRRIRQLLHEQGMTIGGARRVLASAVRTDVPLDAAPPYGPAPTGSPSPVAPAHSAAQAGRVPPPAPLASQLLGSTAVQTGGASIEHRVVREMRDELLALRLMLLAED